MGVAIATRSIDGENLYTDPVRLNGFFNISLSGENWVATVTVQRSFDKGSTWHDVETFTENTQEYGFEPEYGMYYRLGIKEGDYTSGTIVGRLSR